MPTTNCGFSTPYELEWRGPTISVEIGVDHSFVPGGGRRPNLPPNRYPALVDTGAAESCIDAELAMALHLPVVNSGRVPVVGGMIEADEHMAQIYIPELNFTILGPFAGVPLGIRGGDGRQPYYALIGRTFLRHFSMHYDGRTGAVTISND